VVVKGCKHPSVINCLKGFAHNFRLDCRETERSKIMDILLIIMLCSVPFLHVSWSGKTSKYMQKNTERKIAFRIKHMPGCFAIEKLRKLFYR
jgi:hypothetical protein